MTKLATLQTIQLCEVETGHLHDSPTDGDWQQLPAWSAMCLSDGWTLAHCAQTYLNWNLRYDADRQLIEESYGRALLLEFDYCVLDYDNYEAVAVPTGHGFDGSMLKEEVLRYLEHYAPWHLNDVE